MTKCRHDIQVLDIIEGTVKQPTKPRYICMARVLLKCKKCGFMKEEEIGIKSMEERPISELRILNKKGKKWKS